MNATKTELSQLQEQIAAGNAPKLPDGKADEFYWHPTIPGFGLRVYANGSGTWLLQYRTKHGGLQRRHKIGSAAVLNLTFATNAAKKLIGQIADGADPQGDREEARAETRFTFGALAKRFLDERQPGKPQGLGRHSHYMYAGILKNHTGSLARMQHDEIEPKDVTDQIIEIASTSGVHSARYLRTFLNVVYKWGRGRGLITCPNPVADTWIPTIPQSKARALSLDELGAVWRAAEVMAKEATQFMPVRGGRGGHSFRPATGAANSIRSDTTWLSRPEAARQSGIHPITLWEAIDSGELKATRRRDLPANTDPRTIKQGYSKRSHMIQVADLNQYIAKYHVRTAAGDYSAIIRLLILLGGRYSEIAELRWDVEVNLDKATLRIKGEGTLEHRGTKNKHDLILPLPPMAIAILKDIKRRPGRDYVFGDSKRGMGNNNDLKKKLDALIAKAEGAPLQPWRHHDLRHTITTEMNAMGIDSRVVETVTNHRGGHRKGIAGRYNHAMYEKQVKQALEAWAQTVRNVADGVEPGTNVIPVTFGKQFA
jgi:integrase